MLTKRRAEDVTEDPGPSDGTEIRAFDQLQGIADHALDGGYESLNRLRRSRADVVKDTVSEKVTDVRQRDHRSLAWGLFSAVMLVMFVASIAGAIQSRDGQQVIGSNSTPDAPTPDEPATNQVTPESSSATASGSVYVSNGGPGTGVAVSVDGGNRDDEAGNSIAGLVSGPVTSGSVSDSGSTDSPPETAVLTVDGGLADNGG